MDSNLAREFMHTVMRFRRAGMPTPPGGHIHMGEYAVLCRIPENGASLTEIQNNLFMTKSAVSQMLSSLERRKLIHRETDSADRRRITVTLTDEGRHFRHRQHRYAEQVLNITIERFGEDNMKELIRLLTMLADVSEDIRKEMKEQNLSDDLEGDKPLD